MLAILILVASLTVCPHSVDAWGPVGHAVAANIAQTLLTDKALTLSALLLNQTIDTLSLSSVASWADDVKNQPQYVFTKPLHYVNQPTQTVISQCHYDRVRDCSTGCVDSAIQNYTARTINQDMNLTLADQTEAFKFFNHFISDASQPLHAGFPGGGNGIKGTFNKSSTNLHSLWDSGLITYGMRSKYNSSQIIFTNHLLDLLSQTSQETIDEWLSCPEPDTFNNTFVPCSGKWVNESAVLVCEYSYQSDNNTFITEDTRFTLGQAYFNRNWAVVEIQLIKAAVRLAYTINKIADVSGSQPDHGKGEDDEDSMWIIIAAIAAVSLFILVICCGAWIKKRMRSVPKESLLQDGVGLSTSNYSSL